MARIKDLITNKVLKNKSAISTQQLASCMGWQILNDYPRKRQSKSWDIYKNLRGVMLADEVGGGKTFEALGIISKAYLERTNGFSNANKFRVLILANPSIRSKWTWENNELEYLQFVRKNYKPKCDLEKFIYQTNTGKRLDKKLFDFFSKQIVIQSKKQWIGIEKKRQGIWLASFTGLPTTISFSLNSSFPKKRKGKEVFPINFFDFIIVDEAHSLKSGSMDESEQLKLKNSAIRKIYAVTNSNKYAKLILLTATPFQNNINEFKHLLSLLENKEKKAGNFFLTELISKGLYVLESELNKINNDKLPLDEVMKELKNFRSKFDNNLNKLLNLEEEKFIERPKALIASGNKNGIDDFLRDVMVRNVKEPLSITPEIAKLDEIGKLEYLLYRDLVNKKDDEKQMFSTKLSQMVSSEGSFFNKSIDKVKYDLITKLFGKNLIADTKFKKLWEIVDNIKLSNNKTVITIFVSWMPTVSILKSKLEKSGFKGKVFLLTGEDKIKDRVSKLRKIFKTNSQNVKKNKLILIASRVGNEGLDFDKFSNRVIHYDNNFNPAIIDQRNGRVYRDENIISKNGKVRAGDIKTYQLFLEETYDQRILFIEKEKRKFKNFYLGDSGLQKIFEKLINVNKLKDEHEIIKILNSIKIDLTPRKKNLLKKYKNEV